MPPKVSIGLPVRNGMPYLEQAVFSLRQQTFKDFELIIVDNDSTDQTSDFCIQQAHEDKRISYCRNNENIGALNNFKKSFELSTAEYFMWAGHDDLWHPDYVLKCFSALEANPDAVLACTSLRFIDPSGSIIDSDYETYDNPDLSSNDLYKRATNLLDRGGFYAIYGLIRRKHLLNSTNFAPEYGADVLMCLNLAIAGRWCKVPEILFFYRKFPDKTEQDRADTMTADKVIKASYFDLAQNLITNAISSRLDAAEKKMLVRDLASTLFLKSESWRIRLKIPDLRLIRAQRYLSGYNRICDSLSYKKKKTDLKCAIIELNDYHVETIPALVDALNKLGCKPDIFLLPEMIAKNPFAYAKNLNYQLYSIADYHNKGPELISRLNSKYDFIILNSIEPIGVLSFLMHCNVPTLAVIHNCSLVYGHPSYAQAFLNKEVLPLVLSPIAAFYLEEIVNTSWVWPTFTFSEVKSSESDTIRFCLQGNVDFARRNYLSLLDSVNTLKLKGYTNFIVKVVGRHLTPDGNTLREIINTKKLNNYFEFAENNLPFTEFYKSIASSDFLLPLLDTTSKNYSRYFIEKASNSLPLSLSLNIIPVVHELLADFYDLSDIGITYDNNSLTRAMEAALLMTKDEIKIRKNSLKQKQDSFRTQTLFNLQRALRDLGISSSFASCDSDNKIKIG